jgi:hypothetical protein
VLRSRLSDATTHAHTPAATDNFIRVHFGDNVVDRTAVGDTAFALQLYYGMLGSALQLKQDIETRRSRNSFGLIVWQVGV